MKFLRNSILLGLLLPLLCFGQNKFEREMQRDISQLIDQVRMLQSSQDKTLSAMQTLLQNTLDSATKAHTLVAVLESHIKESLREQEKIVAAPVGAVGSKVDQMATEFQGLRESVADLSSQMRKLQVQLVDVSNAIKTLSAPPPPPGGGASPAGAGGGPPAGMSAGMLYQNALRDRSSGNLDLAMQGFQDYLKWYPSTDYAPNAQFYIGEIHYQRGELDDALQAFDLVLEKYSENNKTPDARYMKGQTLLKMNQRTAAAQEFRELIRTSPSSDLAAKARVQLKSLGINPPPSSSKKKR